jgi:hypothetical protein
MMRRRTCHRGCGRCARSGSMACGRSSPRGRASTSSRRMIRLRSLTGTERRQQQTQRHVVVQTSYSLLSVSFISCYGCSSQDDYSTSVLYIIENTTRKPVLARRLTQYCLAITIVDISLIIIARSLFSACFLLCTIPYDDQQQCCSRPGPSGLYPRRVCGSVCVLLS